MKNAKMAIVAVLVALVAVTTYSVGGTYAKYTDTYTGTSDSARVARWAIEMKKDGSDDALTKTFSFDLFKALKEVDGTTAETDVSSTDTVIAPGTGGKVQLNLANNSEVNAQYKVVYTVTNTNNIPIEFYDASTSSWVTALPNNADTATFTAINSGATDQIDIQWRWVFESGTTDEEKANADEADTELGEAATATVEVKAEVIVEQID